MKWRFQEKLGYVPAAIFSPPQYGACSCDTRTAYLEEPVSPEAREEFRQNNLVRYPDLGGKQPNPDGDWTMERNPDGTHTLNPSFICRTCGNHFWIRSDKCVDVDGTVRELRDLPAEEQGNKPTETQS